MTIAQTHPPRCGQRCSLVGVQAALPVYSPDIVQATRLILCRFRSAIGRAGAHVLGLPRCHSSLLEPCRHQSTCHLLPYSLAWILFRFSPGSDALPYPTVPLVAYPIIAPSESVRECGAAKARLLSTLCLQQLPSRHQSWPSDTRFYSSGPVVGNGCAPDSSSRPLQGLRFASASSTLGYPLGLDLRQW